MKKLILVRGHPGSGKSTYAEKLAIEQNGLEVCADKYFTNENGEYKFNSSQIKQAHQYCRNVTRVFLQLPYVSVVIVHNTFTKLWELQQYLDLAKDNNVEVQIIKMNGDFQNVHGVPAKKVQQMKDNYEPHPDETIVQVS